MVVNTRQYSNMESAAQSVPVDTSSSTSSLPSSGLKNTFHGDVFQLKLLMLFLTRGLRAGHKFELGTEMPGVGGKFDDLIFTCEDEGEDHEIKTITSRYLQAKHKFDESDKIKASQLLNESDGDFSLQKYFRSYRDICAKLQTKENLEEHLKDCIIATNIGFDEEDLRKKGIDLVAINAEDTILDFKITPEFQGKIPARYKIQAVKDTTNLYNKLKNSSDMHQLARELLKCGKENKKLELRCDVFKRFDCALVEEKVLNLKSESFHQDFINDVNLPPNAKEFRKILIDCCLPNNSWKTMKFKFSLNFGTRKTEASGKLTCDPVNEEAINNFLDKLVFAVNLPNETQLGHIISTEMGMDFNLLDSRPVSSDLLIKMLNWFKEKSATMLSTLKANSLIEEAKQMMVSIHATGASIGYRDQLYKYMTFNQDAIDRMVIKLEEFDKDSKKVLRIKTDFTKCPAVKVIQSLERIDKFKADDSYLIVQSEKLSKKEEKDEMKNIMRAERWHYLLVVVCNNENDAELEWDELIPKDRKKIIIIASATKNYGDSMEDLFCYNEISDETKTKLDTKHVMFQGRPVQGTALLDNRTDSDENRFVDQPIDLPTFQELMNENTENIVIIPAPRTCLAPENAYIKRQLEFPSFDENFCKQLAQELGLSVEVLAQQCRFDPALSGNIEWLVSGREQVNIWDKMKKMSNDNSKWVSSASKQEDHFVSGDWKSRIMIVSNVAGTGKSTLLSRYFNLIKCNNSDYWVIRLDLVNHMNAISSTTWFDQKKAIEFLLEIPDITGKSSFAKVMLKRRLNVAGRVVLMLDGFDEISSACQNNTIQFIKAIIQTKLERLYITTRPHLKCKLEDGLFQFAFNLQNFNETDQVDYLTATWKTNLNINDSHQEQTIEKFAKSLVKCFTSTMKDKDVIGIPLQCRMLAECYQLHLKDVIDNGSEWAFSHNDKFSLSDLYDRFMKTKDQVFLGEKMINTGNADPVTKNSVERGLQDITIYLRGLAIKTMFNNPKEEKLLWPDLTGYRISKKERKWREEKLADLCIRHGLVDRNSEGGLQFLHRTFAEYLVAEFIFEGFKIDDDENELLDCTGVPEFIFTDILGKYRYKGIGIFLDSKLDEIVVKKKPEWQKVLHGSSCTLPSPLQKFVLRFSIEKGTHWIASSRIPTLVKEKGMTSFALPFSMIEGNANIFRLLWDCIKATNIKQDVQQLACNLMAETNYGIGSIDILKELLDIYSGDDSKTVAELIKTWQPISLVVRLNDTMKKEAIQYMLGFMKTQKKALKSIISEGDPPHPLGNLMKLMMKREFLAEELKRLLLMLSQLYNEDQHNGKFLRLIIFTVSLNEIDMPERGSENLLASLKEIV